jgi:circadian clock protein KaiC
MATGVPGLDLVLNGGLEPGAVVTVAGPPGSGKTILAQQMCFASAAAGRKSVYYTTVSEPHTKLVRHLEQFSFFDLQALGPRIEYIHLGDFLRPEREGGLERMVAEIVRKGLDEKPAIVVIDSAKMLREFAGERELRTALYDLTGRFAQSDTVLLLLGEYTSGELRSDVEFSLADGIIQLEYQPREPVDRRWLRVVKLRGTNPRSGKHTFRIGPGGVEVFPRIETLIPQPAARLSAGRVGSGIPGLDKLMNGGMKRGDATLITGPSGVGKTIFGLGWIAQALQQGERCLYVTFQDTADQLGGMAAGFGWDFSSSQAAGQLALSHVPMGDLDLDVMATTVRGQLAGTRVSRIVFDSLSEMVLAAHEEERFPAYLRSLLGLIRAGGSSLVVTSETAAHGVSPTTLDALMFLFDNVIDLRYIETGSQVARALHVAKMRNSWHEMTLHGFTIGERGIAVGEMLHDVTGRLGWSALRMQAVPVLSGGSPVTDS